MLISKGKPAPSEPWRILEVAIGQAPEVMANRFTLEFRKIHERGIEVLIPMRHNQDGDGEWIVEHIYVRGANGSLSKLAHVPGIEFVRKENADEWWIRQLMSYETKGRPTAKLGDFVRVLTGPCSRMCGTLARIKGDMAVTVITMPTKHIRVHSCIQDLQVVNCPPEHQTFYYQSDLFS